MYDSGFQPILRSNAIIHQVNDHLMAELPRPQLLSTGSVDTQPRPAQELPIKRDRTLAVIPARGGSKGLPRKNIRLLGDKPLVAYSIEAALAAQSIGRVVVSTEDAEIASIAREYGQDLAVRRPDSLAGDKSCLDDVLAHALRSVAREGFQADHVVVLVPTHPFRSPALIDFLTGKLHEGFNPVFTTRNIPCSPWTHMVSRDGWLEPLSDQGGRSRFVRQYGLYSGFSPSAPARYYCHEITSQAELVDIDYESDFQQAELILSRSLFDFGVGQ
jgi:CMP-N-acetylneuraminic acid synthetase